MSNPKNSNSCNHLKEDELPDLSNINVQNISHDNQENSSKPEQSNNFTSNSTRKVKFSDINQVYNISPKKAKKSHNTSSILQTEATNKLQEH